MAEQPKRIRGLQEAETRLRRAWLSALWIELQIRTIFGDFMRRQIQLKSLIPTVQEGRKLHRGTLAHLYETSKRIFERGLRDGPPTIKEFEKAARCGLKGAERYTPGGDVKIWGGTPVFDAACSKAPHRRQAYLQMLRILYAATGIWQGSFLIRVLGPLALWVQDLPASASYHHAHRYGLLDHALEVALASLTECGLEIWPQDHSHCGDPALPGRVLRLSLTLGLLHDIGKVFGVEVRDEESGEIWDPLQEPLVYFKLRNDTPLFTPTRFQFRDQRGLYGHERLGRDLLKRILPKQTWSQIGSPLVAVYDAYLERFDPNRIERGAPIDLIADIMQRADGESTGRGNEEGWLAETRFQKLMEAAVRVPWNQGEPPVNPHTDESRLEPDSEREPEATC